MDNSETRTFDQRGVQANFNKKALAVFLLILIGLGIISLTFFKYNGQSKVIKEVVAHGTKLIGTVVDVKLAGTGGERHYSEKDKQFEVTISYQSSDGVTKILKEIVSLENNERNNFVGQKVTVFVLERKGDYLTMSALNSRLRKEL